MALPDHMHDSVQNLSVNDNHNMTRTVTEASKTITKGNMNRRPLRDIVGDNVISTALAVFKYSLEFDTTSKS